MEIGGNERGRREWKEEGEARGERWGEIHPDDEEDDEVKRRERTGRRRSEGGDDEGGWVAWGGGAYDSSPCLECISQQLWGLMMEVIGTQLGKGDWLWSIPPDEVSELPLMCIKMEYVFPAYLIDGKSVKLIGQNCGTID